jgi:hypothetical protein
MSRRSRSRLLGAGIAGLLLATALPLAGAAHTTPIDGATLASPAVVWVRASVDTAVVVLEHQREITIHSSRYLLPMRQGSGVVVNHSGTVATAASVVAADLQTARIYAINKLFAEVHKVRIANPLKRTHLRDMRLHDKLLACYGSSRSRECIVTSQTLVVEVFPWTAPPFAKGVPAQKLAPSGSSSGIALLQINGATNMPTAALAAAGRLPDRATALGFSRPPKADSPPSRTPLTPDGLKKLTLKAGLSGGPVIDESGRMVGLVAAPGEDGAGRASFHSADEVAKALKAAQIQPQRSVADSTFEEAINYFTGQHDRHAVERFERVLALYPKHALARHFRDEASKLADTPQDRSSQMDEHGGMPEPSEDGGSLTPWLVTGAIGLLALAGAAVFWRRRRAVDRPAGTAAPAAAAPVTAGPAPPQKAPAPKADNKATGSSSKQARPAADPAQRPGRPAGSPATPSAARSPAPGTPVAEPGGNGHDAERRHSAELAPVRSRPTGSSGGRPATDTSMQAASPSASEFAFCTQCGKPSRPGDRFCGHCGNRFG